MSPEQERQMGDAAITTLRAQATEKFRRHIERWLQNTRQQLHGEEPIPHIDALADAQPDALAGAKVSATAATAEATTAPAVTIAAGEMPAPEAANVVPWPTERVANG